MTEPSDAARANLSAFLQALGRQAAAVELVLVLRGGGHCPTSPSATVRIHPLSSPLHVGLSDARNRALAYVRRERLLDGAHIVGFPDDDCRFPDGLLHAVGALLDPTSAALSGPAIVGGPYGPSASGVDRRRFPDQTRSITPALTMRALCSTNVFFAARVVLAVGDFDERFGLGARYGASEDSDYLLRALRLGFSGAYRPDVVFVHHPYKRRHPGQYYLGNVAVLAKHARGGATALLLARRLAGGMLLVGRRALTPREYWRALRAADLARKRVQTEPPGPLVSDLKTTTAR